MDDTVHRVLETQASQRKQIGIAFWYTNLAVERYREACKRMSKGPGKANRKGITGAVVHEMFDTEEKAEQWIISKRWPDGVRCAHCESDEISVRENRKPMPFHCKSCRKYFSVRTNTPLQHSRIPLRKWALAAYHCNTNLKGISSMRLHRELGISQKSAWFMLHRLREAWDIEVETFEGPVESDETYVGGKRKNQSLRKRKESKGRGPVDKTPVVGIKDRDTNMVKAKVVSDVEKSIIQGFLLGNTNENTIVFTDEARVYDGLPRKHEAVKHSVYEYVRREVHTNGIESFWSMFKRGYVGVYHKMSPKHLPLYVKEFAGRHNARPLDTEDQMALLFVSGVGRRLSWLDLVGPRETRYTHGLSDRDSVKIA